MVEYLKRAMDHSLWSIGYGTNENSKSVSSKTCRLRVARRAHLKIDDMLPGI